MENAKISSTQLIILIILFEFGSTLFVGLAFEAKQSAWLAILLGMIGGLILYSIFTRLHVAYPDKPLTTYSSYILGKVLGRVVAYAYIIYFFYLSARVLRDFSDLIVITILKETPLLAVMILFTTIIIFASILGVEAIARTSEFLFPIFIGAGFLFLFSVYVSGIPQIENLQPPLEQGWEKFLKQTFPKTVTFPYGELVVFTMLFPFLNREEKAGKLGVIAIILSTIGILSTNLTALASLGPQLALNSTVPVLDTISMVNIQGIIQRLDPIVISMMVIAGFFKIVIFFVAAYIGIQDVIPLPKRISKNYIIFLMGISLIIVSLVMSESFIEHIHIGLKIIPPYVHVPMQIILPFILLVTAIIRRKINRSNST